MADLPTHPHASGTSGDDPGTGQGRESTTGAPRWVMIVGIIALIVILLFAVMMLVGGGHRPSPHSAPSGVATLVA